MTEEKQKLEIDIDATALGASGCILKIIRIVLGNPDAPTEGGYREKAMSPELVYGIAFHKFQDTMFKTQGNIVAARKDSFGLFEGIPVIPKESKPHLTDKNHLFGVCNLMWDAYISCDGTYDPISLLQECYWCGGTGLDIKIPGAECKYCGGKKLVEGPATEVTFRLKIYEDDTCVINLCGTIDTLGKIKGGIYAIRDFKTTSSWDNRGYFEQYELSRQLRTYILAIKLMAQLHPDSVIGQIGKTRVGAFIDAIFLKKAINDCEIVRSDVFVPENSEIEKFRQLLDDKCKELSQAIKTGYIPKEGILNGFCFHEQFKSKCQFWDVCKSNDTIAELLLRRDFARKKYDPLAFNT